ncbi:hypothetical protein OCL06_01285 [Alteromonas sp. ASW11-19]|uniref:beta-N-acetylhexosaminidase n=1 Tax=Alteromonas salexigens TaxID=2982530 RepID=A0ABT2VLT0_9ALTE|nr:glycoside hydrolase family 3 N-terminal domain-containing protein [Alteromonas salexigens]MCU7553226.1 hypothetical protein [Alteromonas salexigens]
MHYRMFSRAWRWALAGLLLPAFVSVADTPSPLMRQLGQKVMLDLRYFCADGTTSKRCRTPVRTLPPALADMLVSQQVGGVILFAENLTDLEQVVTLNYQLQTLMRKHGLPPLFIAVDQEGGRVARLNDHLATRFVGNMAIGATFPRHGTAFASQVGKGIARELKLLGFNVNFAPSVDVNNNPDNPVINVRSYGEDPRLVTTLGQATVTAMQQEGVLSAIKHFPGHGDTHTDSHVGLPRVTHNRATIDKLDLFPFTRIITSDTPPAMVMSAHIQYPQLDSTELPTRDGTPAVVPATLSKKILSGLLRGELGYEGLIVTDALDMAGIAHFFTPRQALIHTFNAGADIALMPVPVRTPQDIAAFRQLMASLADAATEGELDRRQLAMSAARIANTKAVFGLGQYLETPLASRVSQATAKLPLATNKQVEQALARAAITRIHGKLPLPEAPSGGWHFVMPDKARCLAMLSAMAREVAGTPASCQSLATLPALPPSGLLRGLGALIVTDITPQYSVAEMGGLDNLSSVSARSDKAAQHVWLERAMSAARQAGVPVVMVALRAPYVLTQFDRLADVSLATYGYNVTVHADGSASGAVYDALAEVLSGQEPAQGSLPVSLPKTSR